MFIEENPQTRQSEDAQKKCRDIDTTLGQKQRNEGHRINNVAVMENKEKVMLPQRIGNRRTKLLGRVQGRILPNKQLL
jgi:hypothetical protein